MPGPFYIALGVYRLYLVEILHEAIEWTWLLKVDLIAPLWPLQILDGEIGRGVGQYPLATNDTIFLMKYQGIRISVVICIGIVSTIYFICNDPRSTNGHHMHHLVEEFLPNVPVGHVIRVTNKGPDD